MTKSKAAAPEYKESLMSDTVIAIVILPILIAVVVVLECVRLGCTRLSCLFRGYREKRRGDSRPEESERDSGRIAA